MKKIYNSELKVFIYFDPIIHIISCYYRIFYVEEINGSKILTDVHGRTLPSVPAKAMYLSFRVRAVHWKPKT